jgi:hypothetical protein
MVGNLDFAQSLGAQPFSNSILMPEKGTFKHCHINLPGLSKPVGAIAYSGKLYSCVRLYSDRESAQRGAQRLIERGNSVLLTQVPKGLVLWVSEPDAQMA